jgi:hypothetical protein
MMLAEIFLVGAGHARDACESLAPTVAYQAELT